MLTSVTSAGRTETGKVRKHNEDAILVRDDVGLWVVADGLGGHTAGDYASSMIVERLGALTRPGSIFDFTEAIEDCLAQVNADLRLHAAERSADLVGSTVVVIIHTPDFMLCGWVGDSRGYCFEDNCLRQITSDHVNDSRDSATSGDGEAEAPKAGAEALTRAVGAEDSLFMDWVVAPNRSEVQFLLCSDGINKEISDAELEAEFQRNLAPTELLDGLFDLALSRGARDNVSAVILRLHV